MEKQPSNRAENQIRPFTVGRKNWLFSDTPAGAKASAVIFHYVISASFVVFCKSECPLHPLKQCKNSAETMHLLWDK